MKKPLQDDVSFTVDFDNPTAPLVHPYNRIRHSRGNTLFKFYVIFSMVFFWSCHTLLVRYSRLSTSPNELYSSCTVVFLAEIVKLIVTLFVLLKDYHLPKFFQILKEEFFNKPKELAKMSVPSVIYALQNNLTIIALSNLDAGVYEVISQLKIVFTALFMMLFLRRSFSLQRWLAIILLFAGVALVQINKLSDIIYVVDITPDSIVTTKSTKLLMKTTFTNNQQFIGFIAVFCTCVTAGFAGVYFEMMLKNGSSTSFWIRNLQLYSCGLIAAIIGCVMSNFETIQKNGFLYGFNLYVWLIVAFLGIGGIYTSLVMKYLDNLHKSFASSISIIFVVLFSVILFDDTQLTIFFIIGALTVCVSIILYNSTNE